MLVLCLKWRLHAQEEPIRYEPVFERIDEAVRRHMKAGNVPGLAVVVSQRDGPLRIATYGVADVKLGTPIGTDTLFEVGSLSKSFTAVALLQFAEKGLFDPHAPVKKVLPWFQTPAPYRPLTAHDLLTHTGGLAGDRIDVPTSLFQTVAAKDTAPGVAPGTAFRYSNLGYQILGWMLEELSHQRYGAAVAERILEPLGMTASEGAITIETFRRLATGYRPFFDDRPVPVGRPIAEAPRVEYGSGDGSIASTPADMDRYLRMLLHRGAGPRGRLLSEESFRLLVEPAVHVSPFDPTAYGYGFFVRRSEGHTLIRHTGVTTGMSAILEADLENGIGVVVLQNTSAAEAMPGPLGDYVMRAMRAVASRRSLPEPAPEPSDAAPNPAEYTGTFEAADGQKITFAAAEGRLVLEHRGTRVPLELRGPDAFLADHPDFALHLLRFGRQGDRVVEVTYGAGWYCTGRYQGPRTFAAPKEWPTFAGHYRAANPWLSNFRVFVRKGKLWMAAPGGAEDLLVPAEPGSFQLGEEHTAERMRFDTLVKGRTQRANFSGVDFYRTFTP
jgi:D-alanyl-D-alanine carboxypeptidase